MLPRLYADHDVAAIVYGRGDNPDAVLAEFIQMLLAEGWDVLGILQRRVSDAPSKHRSVEFVLTPEWEWPQPTREKDIVGRASVRLPEIGRFLATALDRKPDLMVFNRFGRAELEGEGLTDILSAALIDTIPIAVAVPRALHDDWITRTGGLTVSLPPDPAQLLKWWRSLGNGPHT